MIARALIAVISPVLLAACAAYDAEPKASADAMQKAEADPSAIPDAATLDGIVAARSAEDRSRDAFRHPAETLKFFGLEPDMTVAEALPGRGWYTRVILPYIAADGRMIALNYRDEMWPLILPDPNPQTLALVTGLTDAFAENAAKIAKTTNPTAAYNFGSVPASAHGEADLVLFIRALHNFNRAGGQFGEEALGDAYALLKPGGVLGVVQHAAPAGATGVAADGTNGYMSKDAVIAMVESAGFVLDAESDINANPLDQPGPDEIVWRLPPTYGLGEVDRDVYAAIGESNRMTLRFRKPAQ